MSADKPRHPMEPTGRHPSPLYQKWCAETRAREQAKVVSEPMEPTAEAMERVAVELEERERKLRFSVPADFRAAYFRAAQLVRADARKQVCRWTDDGEGNYDTDCGGMFFLLEGTPKQNNMRFCGYCGAPLEVIPADPESAE